MGINKVQDSQELSLATALPKRKSSEPFQIPWEDGDPFKMGREYLLQFCKRKSFGIDYSGRITVHVNGIPPHFEIRKSGVEEVVQIKVSRDYLEVNCSCGKKAEGLCSHEARFLYDKIPDSRDLYFKGLYPKVLDELLLWQLKMLHFEIEDFYGSINLKIGNHTTYGRMFKVMGQSSNDEQRIQIPDSHIIADMPAEKSDNVKFFVPLNFLAFGIPVVFPFKSRSPNSDSFTKSYLFDELQTVLFLSPKDGYLERFCKRIVSLILADKAFKEKNLGSLDFYSHYRKNQQQILQVWRDLLSDPIFNINLNFVSTNRSYQYAYQINLSRTYGLHSAQVLLAADRLTIKAHLYDEDVYQKLVVEVYVDGILLEEPTFLDFKNCYFLKIRDAQVLFIDNLEMEYLLRRFRAFDFIVTALPEQYADFLTDLVVPLSKSCSLEIHSHQEIKRRHVLYDPAFKRMLTIREIDNFLHLEAQVVYENIGTFPLKWDANLVIAPKQEDFTYFMRDKIKEEEFRTFILQQHPSLASSMADSNWFIPIDLLQHRSWLHDFIDKCKSEDILIVLEDLQVGTSYYQHQLNCTVRNIHFENNQCAILLALKFGNQAMTISDFEDLIMEGQQVFRLPDSSYGIITKEVRHLYKPLFLSSIRDEDSLVLNTVQLISLQPNLEKIDAKIIQGSIRERREKLMNMDEIPLLNVPDTVLATLRPYQQVGFSWMAFLNEFGWGGLLADDMGLGKTLQVITLLEYYYHANPQGAPSLIVLPNTLLFNWEQEYQKFAPNRLVRVYHGKLRAPVAELEAGTVLLTTYGTLMTDVEEFEMTTFSYLVMDESQAVKNRNSKRFECLSEIKASYRIAMTGTPIENGIQDIYSQMMLVNPGFFGNYRNFNKTYKGVKDENLVQETVGSLQKVIAPFILRRTKKQVALDLPEKTETVLYMDMLPDQRKVYDRYRKLFKGELKENLKGKDASKSKFLAIEALSKLRQICNSPSLIKGEVLTSSSVKLDYIDEILDEDVPGHKVLLFSFYTSMLQLVGKRIAERGIDYAYLDGKLNQLDRQKAVERFQNEDDCRIFLISLKAGGTGLNLTAADYVYILDPWWNPAAEAQAIDRCYRIGQDKHVMAYKIVCKDTVEERILEMQASKKSVADGLILDEANLMKSLSKDDLLKLFE